MPSPQDLARLRRHAPAADKTGWLHPAQQALIHHRGWLKLLAPKASGGAEHPLPQTVRLEEALAAADGSTAWAVTLNAGAGWFAGFLPPDLAREVITTRRVCIAGSGAPTGYADRDRDGNAWRVTGQWSHASGAPMATHFTFNAVLREQDEVLRNADGAPRIRAFIVPAADVTPQPGWFAIGMRASGSHAYALQDIRVTDRQGFTIDPAAATAGGPLYRFDFTSLAWVTLSANLAGMARHFVELAGPLIRQRRPMRAGTPLGDDPAMRQRIDHAAASLADAWHAMLAELDDAWARVEAGVLLSGTRQSTLKRACMELVQAARDAVDGLYPCCGLHAADTRSDINRVWRDFHTASQHALLVPA